MSEAVTPIHRSLGTAAILAESGHPEFHHVRAEHEQGGQRAWLLHAVERRLDDIGKADMVPVVPSAHPDRQVAPIESGGQGSLLDALTNPQDHLRVEAVAHREQQLGEHRTAPHRSALR